MPKHRPNTILLLVLGAALAAACTSQVLAGEGRAARDAKQDTKVTTETLISSNDTYGAYARCLGGDYHPIFDGFACFLPPGETMDLKVFTKTQLGTPQETRIFQVTAHNNDSRYICDDKGAIERGYAATFAELDLGEVAQSIDVCTTVTKAGHNTTEATLIVTEKADGLYVEFRNAGGSWKPTGQYPNSSGQIKVDFGDDAP
ncbi:MAG: hypothetical protein AAGC60_04530 [Acidobacteriota bacterium]